MSLFHLSILAADRPFYEGPCESLVVPTVPGQYGVLAYHSKAIAAIVPGTLYYKVPDQPAQIASVSAGLIKIEDNQVLVLVDSAERPEDIDANLARQAADEAKEEMLQKKSILEYRSAQARLAREISRLRVKTRYTERKQ